MKTVSQRDLKKLEGKGWELTPESKKAIHDQNIASTLTKQVEAITKLSFNIDGVRDAVKAKNGDDRDYAIVINRLIESIKEIKMESPLPTKESSGYKFIVKRGPDGLITEIEAVIK